MSLAAAYVKPKGRLPPVRVKQRGNSCLCDDTFQLKSINYNYHYHYTLRVELELQHNAFIPDMRMSFICSRLKMFLESAKYCQRISWFS